MPFRSRSLRRLIQWYVLLGVAYAAWGQVRQDPTDPVGLAFFPGAPLGVQLFSFTLWFAVPAVLWPLFLLGDLVYMLHR